LKTNVPDDNYKSFTELSDFCASHKPALASCIRSEAETLYTNCDIDTHCQQCRITLKARHSSTHIS